MCALLSEATPPPRPIRSNCYRERYRIRKNNIVQEYSSVPRFEGEEENTSETRDLPVVPIPGIAAPDPLSVIEISKFFEPERVSKGRKKFFEVPEVVQDVCAVAVFVIYHFELNFTVGGCLFGQKIISSMYGIEGLTLDVTIDLERPPGDVFELEGEWPCWRMKTSILLISFLDAFIDRIDHMARACYFWYVDSAEGKIPACISLKGSVGICDANVTQARRARHRFDAYGDSQGRGATSSLLY